MQKLNLNHYVLYYLSLPKIKYTGVTKEQNMKDGVFTWRSGHDDKTLGLQYSLHALQPQTKENPLCSLSPLCVCRLGTLETGFRSSQRSSQSI